MSSVIQIRDAPNGKFLAETDTENRKQLAENRMPKGRKWLIEIYFECIHFLTMLFSYLIMEKDMIMAKLTLNNNHYYGSIKHLFSTFECIQYINSKSSAFSFLCRITTTKCIQNRRLQWCRRIFELNFICVRHFDSSSNYWLHLNAPLWPALIVCLLSNEMTWSLYDAWNPEPTYWMLPAAQHLGLLPKSCSRSQFFPFNVIFVRYTSVQRNPVLWHSVIFFRC